MEGSVDDVGVDATSGKRVGQVGRVECDVMGVYRTDGDGTCIRSLMRRRRWRGPESQGALRLRQRQDTEEPSRLLDCRWSAAGSNQSSVRLWLGPLSQFPVTAAAK